MTSKDERNARIRQELNNLYASGIPSREQVRNVFRTNMIDVLWDEDVEDPDDWAYSMRLDFGDATEGKKWSWKTSGFSMNTPAQEQLLFLGETSH